MNRHPKVMPQQSKQHGQHTQASDFKTRALGGSRACAARLRADRRLRVALIQVQARSLEAADELEASLRAAGGGDGLDLRGCDVGLAEVPLCSQAENLL